MSRTRIHWFGEMKLTGISNQGFHRLAAAINYIRDPSITYISSQRYLDEDIVEEKKREIKGLPFVTVPCTYVGEIEGEDYALIADKHHTMEAAKELGIDVIFELRGDSEGLTGDDLLEARYVDSPYYDIMTGMDVW